MMNKPRGVVTTASDEKGRETVYAVLGRAGESLPWVAPVGRLDKASEGLLLLTNDSEWGARVAAPETHLEKTYHVQIGTVVDERLAQAMVNGVTMRMGDLLRAEQARRAAFWERRTAGLRSSSTKARTGRSGACWKRWGRSAPVGASGDWPAATGQAGEGSFSSTECRREAGAGSRDADREPFNTTKVHEEQIGRLPECSFVSSVLRGLICQSRECTQGHARLGLLSGD